MRNASGTRRKPSGALRIAIFLLAAACLSFGASRCAGGPPARFTAVALGTEGGLAEGNLTAFLLAEKGTTDFLCLDAGTLLSGLRTAKQKGSFKDVKVEADSKLSVEGYVMQKCIRAYCISHAHLDHIAGLVINSTDDGSRPIFALDPTVDYMRDHVFNWKLWPNFGSEGPVPLKKYTYMRVKEGVAYPVAGTNFKVTPFQLCHGNCYPSTAFLVECQGDYALYFGDTGPDAVEKSARLAAVWARIAPLVREKKLRGIFLEISYPNGRKDEELFGHLTPAWMLTELGSLAKAVDPQNPKKALRGLKVVVTHVKPSLEEGANPRAVIASELKAGNDLGVQFVLPEPGQRIDF